MSTLKLPATLPYRFASVVLRPLGGLYEDSSFNTEYINDLLLNGYTNYCGMTQLRSLRFKYVV